MSKTFKELYRLTQEAWKAIKEPIVYRKNKRAIEAAIDSAESQKLEAEENLDKALNVVSEGEVINFNKVLEYLQIIKNANETIEVLTSFKVEFFETE